METQITIKQRLMEFIKTQGIGQKKFARQVGVSDGYVNAIRKSIQPDTLHKIAMRFPELNTGWLMTGEGEMLKHSTSEIIPRKTESEGQPYYDVDFQGGFDIMVNDQSVVPNYYIDYPPYNQMGAVWCKITGKSMEPDINSGDIIAIKELKSWEEFLPFGEIYAIVTTTGMRTVKRVTKGEDPDSFKLVPSNKSEEFVTQEIKKSLISKVFKVVGCMKKF